MSISLGVQFAGVHFVGVQFTLGVQFAGVQLGVQFGFRLGVQFAGVQFGSLFGVQFGVQLGDRLPPLWKAEEEQSTPTPPKPCFG